jgi:Family of unknown function (DUF6062)
MRLRLRSRTEKAAGRTRERTPEATERRSPPSAVTTWLRQGLRSGTCPLCRVRHKADREYVWQFYDERSNDGTVIEEVSRAYGFCAEHVEMLRRIDVEDMKSTLAISTAFAYTFEGIVEQLDRLSADAQFEPEPCPACAARDAYLRKNAVYLLDMLATSPGHRESFEASPGLCFVHFKLVWDLAPTRADRELLLTVQRNVAGSLLDELREHVRKHDHRFAHEPKGSEQDSWQRAIHLTAGWPPPAQSAAEPEHRE